MQELNENVSQWHSDREGHKVEGVEGEGGSLLEERCRWGG
jgi:hypothetical protein